MAAGGFPASHGLFFGPIRASGFLRPGLPVSRIRATPMMAVSDRGVPDVRWIAIAFILAAAAIVAGTAWLYFDPRAPLPAMAPADWAAFGT